MNVADAKEKLTELVAAVERGEEVIIAGEGTPYFGSCRYGLKICVWER